MHSERKPEPTSVTPVAGLIFEAKIHGSKPLTHRAKFQRFLRGKSVFLNSKFQIQEFHAH